MNHFSKEDVTKIAELSYLKVTEEEKEALTRQFENILGYFQVLNQIDVPEELKNMSQDHLMTGRDDQKQMANFHPDSFSPYVENQCFKVPNIIDVSN